LASLIDVPPFSLFHFSRRVAYLPLFPLFLITLAFPLATPFERFFFWTAFRVTLNPYDLARFFPASNTYFPGKEGSSCNRFPPFSSPTPSRATPDLVIEWILFHFSFVFALPWVTLPTFLLFFVFFQPPRSQNGIFFFFLNSFPPLLCIASHPPWFFFPYR